MQTRCHPMTLKTAPVLQKRPRKRKKVRDERTQTEQKQHTKDHKARETEGQLIITAAAEEHGWLLPGREHPEKLTIHEGCCRHKHDTEAVCGTENLRSKTLCQTVCPCKKHGCQPVFRCKRHDMLIEDGACDKCLDLAAHWQYLRGLKAG